MERGRSIIRRPYHLCGLVVLVLILTGIFYFSWIPSPRLQDIRWLPRWIARWADVHDQLRTAVPFVGLGGLVGLAGFPQTPSPIRFLAVWLALSGLALGVEVGQLFVPRRVFDLCDVFWGSVGSGGGLLAAGLIRFYFSKLRRKRAGVVAALDPVPIDPSTPPVA